MLLLVLFFFLVRARTSLSDLETVWQTADWWHLSLALALWTFDFFVMATLWYAVLKALGGRLPYTSALRVYGATLLPRYMPGTVWGYVGRALLCEKWSVPRRLTSVSIVIEIGYLVCGALIVTAIAWFGVGWIVLAGALAALLAIGLQVAWPAQETVQRTQILRRALTRTAVWSGLSLGYIVFWLLYGLANWLIVVSAQPTVDPGYGLSVVGSATLAWLVGFLTVFSPGGLGIREGVLSLSLEPILGPAVALFVSLMARFISLVAEGAFCALTALILPILADARTESLHKR